MIRTPKVAHKPAARERSIVGRFRTVREVDPTGLHLGFNTWFLGRPEIVDFGGLVGFQKVGGFAPDLLEWFLGPPGPPTPQKSTIAGRPQHHLLKTQVYADCTGFHLVFLGLYSPIKTLLNPGLIWC